MKLRYVLLNEYGEEFDITASAHDGGLPTYTIKGTETDSIRIPLFNPKFDVYNIDELRKIGKALIWFADELSHPQET